MHGQLSLILLFTVLNAAPTHSLSETAVGGLCDRWKRDRFGKSLGGASATSPRPHNRSLPSSRVIASSWALKLDPTNANSSE
jgi:hypothetical protein